MIRGNATRGARALVAGCLVAALLLAPVPAGAWPFWDQPKLDWSRVQAVPAGKKTQVRLYDDEAPQGARKVRGRFARATEVSITILDSNGESRTFERRAVRKVRVPRPVYARWPAWISITTTMIVGPCLTGSLHINPPSVFAVLSLVTPTILFKYTATVKEIYNVPPAHRVP